MLLSLLHTTLPDERSGWKQNDSEKNCKIRINEWDTLIFFNNKNKQTKTLAPGKVQEQG